MHYKINASLIFLDYFLKIFHKIFNKSIDCICIKSFNVFLSFLQITVIKRQIFEKLPVSVC